ncbi:hypothetical protein [Helcococcus ovis]|uniref:hypothetical protein n=1 Tax=Helcococcus ovis TaxID=72026 RepID=UPI0038BB275A
MTSVRMPRKEFIISILRGYILVALSVNIISSIFGVNSIWYTMIVLEFITLVVSIVFLLNIKRGDWKSSSNSIGNCIKLEINFRLL